MKMFLPILFFMILTHSCKGNLKSEETLSAQKVGALTRDDWSRNRRPIEIKVSNLSRDELKAMGTLGVIVFDETQEKEDFFFDGNTFCSNSLLRADTTLDVVAYYPKDCKVYGDTLKINFPSEPLFIGTLEKREKKDNLLLEMSLNKETSLLRLRFESDNLKDVLTKVCVSGDNVFSQAHYLLKEKRWDYSWGVLGKLEYKKDQILNSNAFQDITLFPQDTPSKVTISITVDSLKEYKSSFTLPPLSVGASLALSLKLKDEKLILESMWIEKEDSYKGKPALSIDSVRIGYFLADDGSISSKYKENSIALVVSSNGHHGKAVALKDNDASNKFSLFSTGKVFSTLDGVISEGSFSLSHDSTEVVVYSPRVKLPEFCALGFCDGPELMQKVLLKASEDAISCFKSKRLFPSAYIPSLAEMASLAYFLKETEDSLPKEFAPLKGTYFTLSESGKDTVYSIDMDRWFITPYNSKRYARLHTRLFYLF